jgi:SPP1 gp7 family putative phage head morphogenesis protein
MRPASPALHVQLLRREAARFAAELWRALGDDLALSVVPPLEHAAGLRQDADKPRGVSPKTEARLRALLPHEEAERVIAAEAARVRIKRKLDELSTGAGHVDAAVRDQALRVASNNLREFRRVFDLNRKGSVQNIEIRGIQPGIAPAIDAFQRNNAALITRMNENTRDQVREKIDAAWTSGKRVEEIRDEIQERIDVSKSRAELIARDQVLKLNGQITRTRQQSAGVRFYIWTTAGDERVRGSPQAPKSKRDHYHLDGTTQSWDAPPVVAEDGTTAHPGEDYQCRCIAFPVLDENGTEGAGDAGDGSEAD